VTASNALRQFYLSLFHAQVLPKASPRLAYLSSYMYLRLLVQFFDDCRRFDIGLYVTLTSVDPLRVYVFQGEWLIRYA